MSKSRPADTCEPAAEEPTAGDDGREEEDETLTAADQLAPLQVGSYTQAKPYGATCGSKSKGQSSVDAVVALAHGSNA